MFNSYLGYWRSRLSLGFHFLFHQTRSFVYTGFDLFNVVLYHDNLSKSYLLWSFGVLTSSTWSLMNDHTQRRDVSILHYWRFELILLPYPQR